jgi:hypothetical protein
MQEEAPRNSAISGCISERESTVTSTCFVTRNGEHMRPTGRVAEMIQTVESDPIGPRCPLEGNWSTDREEKEGMETDSPPSEKEMEAKCKQTRKIIKQKI